MTDLAAMRRAFRRKFVLLMLGNTLAVIAVYALLLENTGASNVVAAVLLILVVSAQTIRCGPLLTIFAWIAVLPVALALAYLIGAHSALDWSGPGAADEMNFAPIYPVIAVFYAVGFSTVAGILFVCWTAVRKRASERPASPQTPSTPSRLHP